MGKGSSGVGCCHPKYEISKPITDEQGSTSMHGRNVPFFMRSPMQRQSERKEKRKNKFSVAIIALSFPEPIPI
jgi:hypothetical protein